MNFIFTFGCHLHYSPLHIQLFQSPRSSGFRMSLVTWTLDRSSSACSRTVLSGLCVLKIKPSMHCSSKLCNNFFLLICAPFHFLLPPSSFSSCLPNQCLFLSLKQNEDSESSHHAQKELTEHPTQCTLPMQHVLCGLTWTVA